MGDCLERLVSADKVLMIRLIPMIRFIINRTPARRKLPIGIPDLP